MTDAAAARAPAGARSFPFQIRGSLQTLLSLRLMRLDDPDFFRLLLDKIAHSPDFFRSAPIVIDVGPVADQAPLDLATFAAELRDNRLVPVGIQNGSAAWNEAAATAGLAVMGAGGNAPTGGGTVQRPPQQPSAPAAAPPQAQAQAQRRTTGLVVTEPVRSGQQVFCPDGDIVVLAPVGHGAEVAAAGHVHIYGPLRGRAFAGVDGDARAMIFCEQLNAELLSIAGVYLVADELDRDTVGRRARVSSSGDRLVVTTVS